MDEEAAKLRQIADTIERMSVADIDFIDVNWQTIVAELRQIATNIS